MASSARIGTAILGAGMAGLAAGRALAARGERAVLFDKGRAPGGRVASRRAALDDHEIAFDHGAQFLSLRGESLRAAADAVLIPWSAAGAGRYIAQPRMSALARELARGLDVRIDAQVARIVRQDGLWVLTDELGAVFARADRLIVTAPGPQAAGLLASVAPQAARRITDIAYEPCWALMAAFASPLHLPDVIAPSDGPIGFAAREGAKPGRDALPERWIVHGAPAWSAGHLEAPRETAEALLLEALGAAAGGRLPAPLLSAVHRWRYARVAEALGQPCLDAGQGLVYAGDGCLGGRIESAWESGEAAVRLFDA